MIITLSGFLLTNNAYIAGSGDGIVTVKGKPASRYIYLLDANTLAVVGSTASRADGHYIFLGLQPDREYMVMTRDYKKELEPFVWDYVKPANDLDMRKLRSIV